MDPNFTGSCMQHEPREHFRVSMPAQIRIERVDNYANGKIVGTYYHWEVVIDDKVVARRDVFKAPLRSRAAAVAQGKRAARAHVEWLASRVPR